ncbi:hypothetical protein NH340_JMT05504 [Sarcoptes scabiei]|nr:hypothetical protein NH340_JMT05504 [Sarcoptes scabiei]
MEQHFRRNNQSNQSDTMIFRPWDSCPVTMDSSKSFPIQSSSSNLEERNLSKSLTSNQREIKTASPISLEKIQTNEVIDIVSTKSIQFQSKPLIRCPSLSNYSNLNPSSPKDLLDLFHVQFKNASLINPFVVPKDSSRNNYVMDEHSLFPRTPSLPLPFRANHYFDQSFLKNYPTNFPLPDRTIFDQMMIASSKTNQFLKNSMMLKMMNSVPQTSSGEQEFFEKQSLLQSNPTNSANTSSSIVSLSNGSNKKQRPKRFQCPHCQVSFSNNGQLKGHIRIHTGNE